MLLDTTDLECCMFDVRVEFMISCVDVFDRYQSGGGAIVWQP